MTKWIKRIEVRNTGKRRKDFTLVKITSCLDLTLRPLTKNFLEDANSRSALFAISLNAIVRTEVAPHSTEVAPPNTSKLIGYL